MKSLISFFLFFLITFYGEEKALEISPDIFRQSKDNRAWLGLSKGYAREEKMKQVKNKEKEKNEIRWIRVYNIS